MNTRRIDEEIAVEATERLYDSLCLMSRCAPSEELRQARNHLYDGMLLLSRANVPTPIDLNSGKARKKERPEQDSD